MFAVRHAARPSTASSALGGAARRVIGSFSRRRTASTCRRPRPTKSPRLASTLAPTTTTPARMRKLRRDPSSRCRSGWMSQGRSASQTSPPTTTGITSIDLAYGRDSTATAPIAARTMKTICGRTIERSAARPAYQKASASPPRTPGHQQRLVVLPDSGDRKLGHGPWRDPDDQFGDSHHRVHPNRHQGGHQQAGAEAGAAGQEARRSPAEPPQSGGGGGGHPSIVAQGMIRV